MCKGIEVNLAQRYNVLRQLIGARLSVLFGLLLISLSTAASPLVLDGTERHIDLTPYMEVYLDASATQDITALADSPLFIPASTKDLQPGYTRSAIWMRLTLKNNSAAPVTRWIAITSPRLQEVSLFVPQNAYWVRWDAGLKYPFATRVIEAPNPAFSLKIPASQTMTIYLRVSSRTSIKIVPGLWDPIAFQEDSGARTVIDALLIGGLCVTSIYLLLMYGLLRDRGFLLHAITIFCYGVYQISVNGYGMMYFWPNAIHWGTQSIGVSGAMALLCLALFMRNLLSTRERLPHWDRFLVCLLVIYTSMAIAQIFGDYDVWARRCTIFSNAIMLTIVIISGIAARRHFPAMRFYLIAFVIALLGNLLHALGLLGIMQDSAFIKYQSPLSTIIANLFFLAAVLDRVIQNRKEKEVAQQALLTAESNYRSKLERDVQTRTADLNKALTEINQANQSRSRLMAFIGHDLRTPLATIINYVHRLNRHASGVALEYQSTIEHCAAHQLALIDDLVEYARGELEQLELNYSATYLHAWLTSIARQAELLAGQFGNQFEAVLAPDLPPVVMIDPKRLRQVLLNLLSNAAKFTVNGYVQLRVSVESMSVDVCVLNFTVSDSGRGMPEDAVHKIFEPFTRLQSEQQGSGLGLSVAQQIVRSMGGRLTVKTELGKGSEFSFRMTVMLANESEIAPAVVPLHLDPTLGTGKTIMIIDDNAANRDYLYELLAAADFDVVQAADGQDALQKLSQQKVDAILVDQYMPRMGGWEVLRAVREQGTLQALMLPIILCSAMPPARPENFPPEISFNGILLKPVQAALLLNLLRSQLGVPSRVQLAEKPDAQWVPITIATSITEPATALPPAFAEALRPLVEIGSITDIEALADQLAQAHPEQSANATLLRNAARRIDLATLATFVQTHSSGQD